MKKLRDEAVHVMFVNEHHANVGKFSEKMSVF